MRDFFMNTFNSKKNKLFLMVALVAAMPLHGMESEVVEVVSTEQQSEQETANVWYENRSTQIAAAAVVCAVAAYAIAVRMNKLSSPVALLTALFAPKVVQAITKSPDKNVNVVDEKKKDLPVDESNADNKSDDKLLDQQPVIDGTQDGVKTADKPAEATDNSSLNKEPNGDTTFDVQENVALVLNQAKEFFNGAFARINMGKSVDTVSENALEIY
jgi:hypothetical protein